MIENLKKILKNSYIPYSKYAVACVLVMKNNQEFIGVNVENASFKNGLCAEQVAIASAIAEGYTGSNFKEIHIMGSVKEITKPCFLCRELLVEFFSEEAKIFCYNKSGKCEEYTVNDLCPHPFILKGDENDK